MGISGSCFRLFMGELSKGHIKYDHDNVMQLGRQHTFITYEEAFNISKTLYRDDALKKDIRDYCHQRKSINKSDYIDDYIAFRLLNFRGDIHSMDVSDYENPTYVHDLNFPVPKELHGKYDLVFDGGTLEHVYDVKQVMNNIHAMLKPNGIVIHSSPSHNHVDHGYYMFSPIFFSDYYHANNYQTLNSYLFEYTSLKCKWDIYKYVPGCLAELSMGGFGKQLLGIWHVAKKNINSTCDKIPRQEQSIKRDPPPELKTKTLRDILKKSAIIHNLGKSVKAYYRGKTSRKRNLKLIGKF